MDKHKIELYVFPALLFIILILPHIFFLGNYYVDLETQYVDAGTEISENWLSADLSKYYKGIANPILTSIFLAVGYAVVGESPLISRLTILLISVTFCYFTYFYLRKKDFRFAAICSLLVAVNPMFIVYGQYVHTDAPFMVFSGISFLLLIFSSCRLERILSSIFLGISLATKYVTVILLPCMALFLTVKYKLWIFSRKKTLSFIRFSLWYFGLAILVSMPIIILVFFFQESFFSASLSTTHKINIFMIFEHLIAYLLWLGLFIGPFFIFFVIDLLRKMGKRNFYFTISIIIVGLLILSAFIPFFSLVRQEKEFGEMNLGWADSYIPSWIMGIIIFFILLVALIFVVNLLHDVFILNKDSLSGIAFWILIPILLMSLTRAANRYLLVILLPLSLYSAQVFIRIFSDKRAFWFYLILILHMLIFLSVGVFSNYYLHLRGVEILSSFA